VLSAKCGWIPVGVRAATGIDTTGDLKMTPGLIITQNAPANPSDETNNQQAAKMRDIDDAFCQIGLVHESDVFDVLFQNKSFETRLPPLTAVSIGVHGLARFPNDLPDDVVIILIGEKP
jgi:hypothetical protein